MKNKRWLLSLFILAIFTFSCSQQNQIPGTTGSPGKPGDPGSSSISDPTQGLSDLPSYRASFSQSFSGTQLGKPSQWSKTYTLSVVHDSKARFMTYKESGLDPNGSMSQALEGTFNGASYSKDSSSSPCVASFTEKDYDPLNAMPELAGMLPPVTQLKSAGAVETINGISTQPYTFDASGVTQVKGAVVEGKLWLAESGGYVVKYNMKLTGGNDVFDADTSGSLSWDYQLETLDPAKTPPLPLDCPLALPELPTPEDAGNVLRFPGYISFETKLEPQAVLDFFKQNLPTSKFTLVDDIRFGTEEASMIYSDGSQNITFVAETGNPTRVSITGQSLQQMAAVTPEPTKDLSAQSTAIFASPQMRAINSLSLLIGQDPNPSVFSSYHMESYQKSPNWDENTSQVLVAESWLSVDAQGKNIHFISKDKKQDGTESTSEVYMIGDKEYEVQNGVTTPGLGLSSLTWVMWPLDPLMLLGIGSSKATQVGTETLDGRSVDVYQLAGTTADDLTGLYSGFGFIVTKMDGKVWIDSQTGALLKTAIDYEAEIKDSSSNVQGKYPGHFEIIVSKINNLTVNLP